MVCYVGPSTRLFVTVQRVVKALEHFAVFDAENLERDVRRRALENQQHDPRRNLNLLNVLVTNRVQQRVVFEVENLVHPVFCNREKIKGGG